MQNIPLFHLEISGRGSAKSYRIHEDIVENQKKNPFFRSSVVVVGQRAAKISAESLLYMGGNLKNITYILSYQDFISNKDRVDKIYIDEFDYIEWLTPEIAEEMTKIPSMWVSGSSKVREMENFSSDTDVLAKLIQLNGGFVINRPLWTLPFVCQKSLKEMRESFGDSRYEVFQREFLAQFLK